MSHSHHQFKSHILSTHRMLYGMVRRTFFIHCWQIIIIIVAILFRRITLNHNNNNDNMKIAERIILTHSQARSSICTSFRSRSLALAAADSVPFSFLCHRKPFRDFKSLMPGWHFLYIISICCCCWCCHRRRWW